MPKFYLQSGNVRTVISADDSQKAALWVVHQALQQVVPVYDDDDVAVEEKEEIAIVKGIMVLGNSIRVSEIGFDREGAEEIDTFELLVHWHQLMVALDKLSAMLEPQTN